MDRREFLKRGALAAAGAAVSGSVLSGLVGLSGCAKKEKRIGLQLYSLREAMGEDPLQTLKLVSEMGYKELETAYGKGDGTIYGYAPAELRKICEDLGMAVSGCHVGKPYDPENTEATMEWWNQTIDLYAAAGCSYVVMPWFQIGETLDSVKQYADYFNSIGQVANAKGVKFGFHNHAGEFRTIEDHVVMDYLIENTDPANVFFELDVYWAKEGGVDPAAYINKYAGRFPVLHIKDESIIGDSGKLDFKPIFEAAYAQGMKDYYVEVEKYTLPPANCVEKSYDYLFNAEFVK